MFDFVRNNQRVLQFILVLLIFPSFVFLGLQGYDGFKEGGGDAAQVGELKISAAEWDATHRNSIERLRAQDAELDIKQLDTPEARQQTLQSMLRERTLLLAAQKQHLAVSDERLARLFQTNADFAFLRNPDGTLNRALIEAQGMSVAQFEARLRQDLAVRQVLLGIGNSPTGSRVAAESALDALMQRREVRLARFDAGSFRAKVEPSEAEIEAHYQDPANAEALSAPERLKLAYLVLDATQIAAKIQLTDAEVQAAYEANAALYSQPEERRARHILIQSDAKDPADRRAAARAKATEILALLREKPERFAELAKERSEDKGSAARGGDLDYFGRGAMAKPFEDMVFKMPVGAISELVETEFGFHIIQTTGERGKGKRTLAEVREEIEGNLRKERAQKLYAEQAEAFSNLVYEQSDSLQPAADKLGLTVQTGSLIGRSAVKDDKVSPLGSAKFVAALFTDAVLKDKRNTETVDLGGNRLAAARIVEYREKRKLSLEEAREIVRSRVGLAKAAELARQEGQAKLALWKGAEGAAAESGLAAPVTVSRPNPQGLSPAALDAVLAAPADKLPAWLGVDLGGDGYLVARVDKVLPRDPAAGDAKQLQGQYAALWASIESDAYVEALKTRYKARVLTPKTAKPVDGAAR